MKFSSIRKISRMVLGFGKFRNLTKKAFTKVLGRHNTIKKQTNIKATNVVQKQHTETEVNLASCFEGLNDNQLFTIYQTIETITPEINANSKDNYDYFLSELIFSRKLYKIFYDYSTNKNKILNNNGENFVNWLSKELNLDVNDVKNLSYFSDDNINTNNKKFNINDLVITTMKINEYINTKIPELIKEHTENEAKEYQTLAENKYKYLKESYEKANDLLEKQKLFNEIMQMKDECKKYKISCDIPEDFTNLKKQTINEQLENYKLISSNSNNINRRTNNHNLKTKQKIIKFITELCKGNDDNDCKNALKQLDPNTMKTNQLRSKLDELLHMSNNPEKFMNARDKIDALSGNTTNTQLLQNISTALKDINAIKAPQALKALKQKLEHSSSNNEKQRLQETIIKLLKKYPDLVELKFNNISNTKKTYINTSGSGFIYELLKQGKKTIKQGKKTIKQKLLNRDIAKCLKKITYSNAQNISSSMVKIINTINDYHSNTDTDTYKFSTNFNNIITNFFQVLTNNDVENRCFNELLSEYISVYDKNIMKIDITTLNNKLKKSAYFYDQKMKYFNNIMYKLQSIFQVINDYISGVQRKMEQNIQLPGPEPEPYTQPQPLSLPPSTPPPPPPPPPTRTTTQPIQTRNSIVYTVPIKEEIYADPQNAVSTTNLYEEIARPKWEELPHSTRRSSGHNTRKNNLPVKKSNIYAVPNKKSLVQPPQSPQSQSPQSPQLPPRKSNSPPEISSTPTAETARKFWEKLEKQTLKQTKK
jgi:hypothetical protein